MCNTKKTKRNSKQDTITINEYAPGTCYGCQICLHCKNNNCDCDKSIKPKTYSNKKKEWLIPVNFHQIV